MSTFDAKNSPSKKANDDAGWQTNWWDLHPLVEDVRRPIAWSSSSTIFTAHPTQPVVIGRLFPSSSQFLVVSPDSILRSPLSYGPPIVISVSPNDLWLFAFFPSYENDGIACIWSRGSCVDSWLVKESWSFSRGAGVITCAWAGTEREWSTSPDGSSFRLPPRGPVTPVSNPTLLLVTQAHQLQACYLRPHVPSLKILSCSLIQPYFTSEGQPLTPLHDTPTGLKTSRLCIYAAIGLIYGESSVLVAMRSRRYPTSDNLRPAACNEISQLEWGTLAEEQTIELCEVRFRFDGIHMNLGSQPLPPIHHPFPCMNGLTFVCSPPSRLDPSASPRTSPKRDRLPVRVAEISSTFLVASFLDFEEYSTFPKSSVVTYVLTRGPSSAIPGKIAWTVLQVAERTFFPRVLALSCPAWPCTNSRKRGLIALLADAGGPMSRRNQKTREVKIGNIIVLRLPDLTDDPDWEQSPIIAPISRAGMDWPVDMSTSRSQVLLCAATLRKTSVYSLPRLMKVPVSGESAARNISPISMALVTSLQSHISIADIAHILATPAVSLNTIVDALRETWLALEINSRSIAVVAFGVTDVLGATVEIYRTRARLLADEEEKDLVSSLWKNAHDMCSVAACLAAFEDCKESEGYDLEAIWQLVSLSGWVVGFLEKLVKECLSAVDLTDLTPNTNELHPKLEPVDDVDVLTLDGSLLPSPLDSPILLHLTHPPILANLIEVVMHVNRFYHSLRTLAPKEENSQIARDVLMDTIECSGLDLRGIEDILKGAMSDAKNIPMDEARLSLSRCHPVPAQYPFLQKMVHTLYTSTAIDKSRLFIKAADLVDGFANLSTLEQVMKKKDRDVVTKGVLVRRNPGLLCLRCGYKSEIGGEVSIAGHTSLKWKTWERMWANRCVCGGAWINGSL